MTNTLEQFRAAMRAVGLKPPEVIEPGKLHRCPTNGRRNDAAGWCKLFDDGRGGVFGDFRTELYQTWQAKHDKPFSTAEREAFRKRCEAERREREAEQARRHAEAAAKAGPILEAATGDPTAHPYAINKAVPFGPLAKRGPWPQRGWSDALLFPVYDGNGNISTVEAINKDGEKDFLYGGKKRGGFFPFGRNVEHLRTAERILIGEGTATVAAAIQATGLPAIAAMDAAATSSIISVAAP